MNFKIPLNFEGRFRTRKKLLEENTAKEIMVEPGFEKKLKKKEFIVSAKTNTTLGTTITKYDHRTGKYVVEILKTFLNKDVGTPTTALNLK